MDPLDPRMLDVDRFDELFDVPPVALAEESPIGLVATDPTWRISPADLTPAERAFWFLRSWQLATDENAWVPTAPWEPMTPTLTREIVVTALVETVQTLRILDALAQVGDAA